MKLNLKELERRRDRKNVRYYAQRDRAMRVALVSSSLEKPIGFFIKKCPQCKKRLKVDFFHLSGKDVYYWECKCGYEYGILKTF